MHGELRYLWCLTRTLCYLMLSSMTTLVLSTREHTVYWNSSNPMFQLGANHALQVHILDRVTIKCPTTVTDQLLVHESQIEYSQIYRVSKRAYDTCQLDSNAQTVGVCNRPNRATELSIVIRDFTPIPGGMEYIPGNTYYFISTSSGKPDGLAQRQGGLCLYNNIKMKFDVLFDDGDPRAYQNTQTDRNSVDSWKAESTTQLMYIVEEIPPDDPYWQQHGYTSTSDDEGLAVSLRSNLLLLLVASIFTLTILDVRIR